MDILSNIKIFLECDFAKGMILEVKTTGNISNFTLDILSGYKYIANFRGRVQRFIIETEDLISSISFKLNEKSQLVSFKGESVSFRLSTKEN